MYAWSWSGACALIGWMHQVSLRMRNVVSRSVQLGDGAKVALVCRAMRVRNARLASWRCTRAMCTPQVCAAIQREAVSLHPCCIGTAKN